MTTLNEDSVSSGDSPGHISCGCHARHLDEAGKIIQSAVWISVLVIVVVLRCLGCNQIEQNPAGSEAWVQILALFFVCKMGTTTGSSL
jgi:hypothetical protein